MRRAVLKPDVLLVVFLIIGLGVGGFFIYVNHFQKTKPEQTSSVATLNEVATDDIRKCLKSDDHGGRAVCLDKVFQIYLQTGASKQALALLHQLSQDYLGVRAVAHPVAHGIDRATCRQ